MTEIKKTLTTDQVQDILHQSNDLMMRLAATAALEWRDGMPVKSVVAALVSALAGFCGAAKSEGQWVKEEDDFLLALLLHEVHSFIEAKDTELLKERH